MTTTRPRDTFATMPTRLVGELEERLAIVESGRVLQYHVSFFDDCLRAILPHDLIVLCGKSGKGKTEIGLSIATENAKAGRNVHHFALEAEPKELERRTKYSMLARLVYQTSHGQGHKLNYTDWYLGRCEHIVGHLNVVVDRTIAKLYKTLHTFYRTVDFDTKALATAICEIADDTDLVVIDHMHYVDVPDENENRGFADLVKTLRDVSLRIGKPIILVAHLRKRDPRLKQLVPTLDDVHGTSNISKICTQAIAIEPAVGIDGPEWWLAPTFMTVLKDRRGAPTSYVAVAHFNLKTKSYEDNYSLGFIRGSKWIPHQKLEGNEVKGPPPPDWAARHLPWSDAALMPMAAPQLPLQFTYPDAPHAADGTQ